MFKTSPIISNKSVFCVLGSPYNNSSFVFMGLPKIRFVAHPVQQEVFFLQLLQCVFFWPPSLLQVAFKPLIQSQFAFPDSFQIFEKPNQPPLWSCKTRRASLLFLALDTLASLLFLALYTLVPTCFTPSAYPASTHLSQGVSCALSEPSHSPLSGLPTAEQLILS